MGTNTIPTTALYHAETMQTLAYMPGTLSGTFNASGVDEMASADGVSISFNVGSGSATSALAVTGAHAYENYTSTQVTLTLTGQQSLYTFTQVELDTTKYEIMMEKMVKTGSNIVEYIESLIGTFLNLKVRHVAGAVTNTLNDLAEVTAGSAILSTYKAPLSNRTAAIAPNGYQRLVGQDRIHGVDASGNTSLMTTGRVGEKLGLGFREAVYGYTEITNPAYGAAALTVKTTVAAGLSALVITGLTASTSPVLKAGTIFSIKHSASSNVVENYVIQADVNSNTSTEATVAIFPALKYVATATDVIEIKTGAAETTFRKSYVYHQDFAAIASRGTAVPNNVYSVEKVPGLNWILTSKVNDADSTHWQQHQVGSSTLFDMEVIHDDWACAILHTAT